MKFIFIFCLFPAVLAATPISFSYLESDKVILDTKKNILILEDNVLIKGEEGIIKSQYAEVNRYADSQTLKEINAHSNIQFCSTGVVMEGETLHYNQKVNTINIGGGVRLFKNTLQITASSVLYDSNISQGTFNSLENKRILINFYENISDSVVDSRCTKFLYEKPYFEAEAKTVLLDNDNKIVSINSIVFVYKNIEGSGYNARIILKNDDIEVVEMEGNTIIKQEDIKIFSEQVQFFLQEQYFIFTDNVVVYNKEEIVIGKTQELRVHIDENKLLSSKFFQ